MDDASTAPGSSPAGPTTATATAASEPGAGPGTPAADAPPSATGWAAPAGWASPEGGSPQVPVADGAADRRRSFVQFGIAIALVAVGLITTFAASGSHGGIIWTGAYLIAVSLLVRSVVSYRASVRAGGSSPARDRPLLAGAALVVIACLVVGGLAIARISDSDKDAHASTGVGSCWREGSGQMLQAVDCSHEHTYVGTRVVDEDTQCDDAAVGTVPSDDGRTLCLDPA